MAVFNLTLGENISNQKEYNISLGNMDNIGTIVIHGRDNGEITIHGVKPKHFAEINDINKLLTGCSGTMLATMRRLIKLHELDPSSLASLNQKKIEEITYI